MMRAALGSIAFFLLAPVGIGLVLPWLITGWESSGPPLVVGGLYRYVRNPMYVGVIALILGQALALFSLTLVLYAAAFTAVVMTFVRLYEEPALTAAHGDSFLRYRAAVPGWIPRLKPWSG
jgi:protein-S-isoprenylcysteine O-methyltransferase Ste14